MSILDVLLGRPLSTFEEEGQRIGLLAGIAIFGLDALSSAAYGPEAALTVMRPMGDLGNRYIVPISLGIVALLTIVFFSYRQTIAAYPGGGGSYTVARENLGAFPGLLAGTALMIDYILTVAVGISAGVGALVSAAPALQPHTLSLCLAILAAITLINLRGIREAGLVFMAPTYLFVGSLLIAIAVGIGKTLAAGGSPVPVMPPPLLAPPTAAVGLWLLLQAFSSGCAAMTGVEAVSNGVSVFREPTVKTAQRTLAAVIAILIMLLGGIAYLSKAYRVGATEPGAAGYQSTLSQLLGAISGRGWFYSIAISSIVIVLVLSANTSFADFPRLCRIVSRNGYLPNSFGVRGRRLVYTEGILVLCVISGVLLVIFGGVTDRLIPLYAIGAFMAFTLSQAGMVMHWKRTGGRHAGKSMLVNAVGATATGITAVVVLVAKFAEGAWITMLLIPSLLAVMISVKKHYDAVSREIVAPMEFSPGIPERPLVVLPLKRWSRVAANALRFAMNISPDVYAIHIDCEETDEMKRQWQEHVARPARESGFAEPRFEMIPSPYRYVVTPIVEHILQLELKNPERTVAVVIPEMVERHWYDYLLHNQRASLLKALLLVKGDRRIVVINVPWYLN
jgi:amino acid transporter